MITSFLGTVSKTIKSGPFFWENQIITLFVIIIFLKSTINIMWFFMIVITISGMVTIGVIDGFFHPIAFFHILFLELD